MLQKNDVIRLNIDALTSQGSGVGRYNGMAVFVRNTVPGDIIDAHVIKLSKNYAVAIIDSIVTPSPSRIENDCPAALQCGGCSFRQMVYDEELKYKLTRVNDALKRIGHLDYTCSCIAGADSISNYRNKAQYPVKIENGNMQVGFYAYKSHRIIPCDDCLLQPEEFKKGIAVIKEYVKANNITSYDENTGTGLLRHIYFRKAFGTSQLMVCLVINGSCLPKQQELMDGLISQLPDITSICININVKNTNVVLGDKTITIYGSDTIEDVLLGKRFIVSPASFYQVNHRQCERLYTIIKEYAALKGDETVLDLYCGAGTIGLTLADSVKTLIGVEIVSDAVDNANQNARLNGTGNARFMCADALTAAKQLAADGIKPDIVIVDPPRKGCDSGVFDAIELMGVNKIIYVSCDPSTLARDLAILAPRGYTAESIQAVDMFPRTPHVETVVLLSHKKPDSVINVKVEFGEGMINSNLSDN